MADKITADVGDEAESLAIGKGNQQQRNAARQNMRAGDINFTSPDSLQIWVKLLDMAAQIRELTIQMDDLPRRVTRLEDTEVIVRPGPEVVIRPAARVNETTNLSLQTVLIIVLVAAVVVVALVGVLVYLQVSNG